jgi:hypothetical protein
MCEALLNGKAVEIKRGFFRISIHHSFSSFYIAHSYCDVHAVDQQSIVETLVYNRC